MKICGKCGATFDEQTVSDVCSFCGEKLTRVQDDAPVQTFTQPQQKGKGGFLAKLLSVVVAVAVGAGVKIGMEKIFEHNREKDALKELNKTKTVAQAYIPGQFDSTGYSSLFWNMRMNADNHLLMMEKAELDSLQTTMAASMESSIKAGLENSNVSEKVKQEAVDSVSAKTEMGFYLVDSSMEMEAYGFLMTMSLPTTKKTDISQVMEESIKKAGSNQMQFISSGQDTLAGQNYDVVKCKVTQDGVSIIMNMYCRTKGGMTAIMYLYYPEGLSEAEDHFKQKVRMY